MNHVDANRRPTTLSGALSLAFGVGALALLAVDGVTTALAVELLGVALLAAGVTLAHRGWRLVGALVGVGALGVVAAALALVWTNGQDLLVVAQFAPGIVGVLVLALGVVPLRGTGSRRLVTAGAGLLTLSVFVAGVVQQPALPTLLWSGAATVLAWDAGENAVGVGAQLGRTAKTGRVEALHLLGTAFVAGVAVVAARVARGMQNPNLPLSGFVLLLIGLVLLAVALHE